MVFRKTRSLKSKHLHPPVARLIGFRLTRLGKGFAVCEMRADTKHKNTIGTVHGGILCDLADAAMGFAFSALLASGGVGVTIEFKINFLRPVYPPERLQAHAQAVSRGKRICYLECSVRNASGRLVAKAASTCKTIRQSLPKAVDA